MCYISRIAFTELAREQAVFWDCSFVQAVRTLRAMGVYHA